MICRKENIKLEDSLDKHSLKHCYLSKNKYIRKLLRHREATESILWDLVNDHDICYATSSYLFKVDLKKGKNIIRIIKSITLDSPIVYLAYTNISHLNQSSRIYQDIWAFSSQDQANNWQKEMQESIEDVKNSHLIRLNLKDVNLNTGLVNDQDFIDPYYSNDIGQHKLTDYQRIANEKPKVARVPIFSDESIIRIANSFGEKGSSVYINMVEYNTRAQEHNKQAQFYLNSTNLHRISILNEEAKKLKYEYNSYRKHL